jgi:hypothetical protein
MMPTGSPEINEIELAAVVETVPLTVVNIDPTA